MDYVSNAVALAFGWMFSETWSWGAILSTFFAVIITQYLMGKDAMKELVKSLGIAFLAALATAFCVFVFYFAYSAPRQLLTDAASELTAAQKKPGLLYSESEADVNWPNSPYKAGKRVVIQSNTSKKPFGIRIYTDVPVDQQNCRQTPTMLGGFRSGRQYGSVGVENGAFIECRLDGGIGPEDPWMVMLYAKQSFTVTKWEETREP